MSEKGQLTTQLWGEFWASEGKYGSDLAGYWKWPRHYV